MSPHLRLNPPIKAMLLLVVSIPLLGINSFETLFAPKADPWPRWKTNVSGSSVRVDHGRWDDILRRYVRTDSIGINRVDYARLNRDGRDDLAATMLASWPICDAMPNRNWPNAWHPHNASTGMPTIGGSMPCAELTDRKALHSPSPTIISWPLSFSRPYRYHAAKLAPPGRRIPSLG